VAAINDWDRETLADDERAVVEVVEQFALDVLRPVGTHLDKLADPAEVSAPASPLFDVFARYESLGVDPASLTEAELAPERRAHLQALVAEVLGWGDAGLAIGLEVSAFPRLLATLSGDPDLIGRFGAPGRIGCWPITEPDHGSDILFYRGHLEDMVGRPNCLARRDGDQYVVQGQKAAWVSNGTIADAAALFCAVQEEDGTTGLGALLVDLDDPAVTRGKPLDKLGQRALDQGEVFFDGLRVDAHQLVVPPAAAALAGDLALAMANAAMGSTFVGVAQAALDHAVVYTRERVQGGGPLVRHQGVRSRLFEMHRRIEAARALSRAVILRNTLGVPDLPGSIASKVTATQTAFEVANDAVQLFGGNGLSREYPVEKLLRDARASLIEDGSNDVLGLIAAERLLAAVAPDAPAADARTT
jgi:alkylation response protein AidB-like acyl-CoA dehydrogenase